MDRIKNLLKRIDEFDLVKFSINKNTRIFLKKLLLDDQYLKDIVEKNSEDHLIRFLSTILDGLYVVKKSIDDIDEITDNALTGSILEIESEKEKLLNKFILDNLEKNK